MSRRSYAGRRDVKYRTRSTGAPKLTRTRARARLARQRAMPVPRRSITLEKQVRALVASKRKETADVDRFAASWSATYSACMTSSTVLGTAASGTGLIDCDADEVLVNSIHLRGALLFPAILDLDPVGDHNMIVRKIIVFFNKPLLVPSAAGTLPPITEVLQTDDVNSLYVTAAANGGRFTVLSDRLFDLGSNTYQAVTAVGHSRCYGKNYYPFDYTVKVGKMMKFKAPSQSGSALGGHYDSDVPAGMVDRGLIVMYNLIRTIAPAVCNEILATRVNYTG